MSITIKLVDMKFFDREQEFEKLREIEELSYEVAQFTIITGRRRIGKTEMVKKFYENKTLLYFFVARKAEADLCNIFVDEIRTKLGIPMLDSKGMSFATVFKFIMELSQTQHINLFIDASWLPLSLNALASEPPIRPRPETPITIISPF